MIFFFGKKNVNKEPIFLLILSFFRLFFLVGGIFALKKCGKSHRFNQYNNVSLFQCGLFSKSSLKMDEKNFFSKNFT